MITHNLSLSSEMRIHQAFELLTCRVGTGYRVNRRGDPYIMISYDFTVGTASIFIKDVGTPGGGWEIDLDIHGANIVQNTTGAIRKIRATT